MNKKSFRVAAIASALVLSLSTAGVAYAADETASTETVATEATTELSFAGAPAVKVAEFGDFNSDGAVDAKDAVKVLQYFAESIIDKTLTVEDYLSKGSEETTAVADTTETVANTTETVTNTTDATETTVEDATEAPIVEVSVNGAADEATTESTEETTVSTETTTVATVTYSLGDVNGDGSVDAKDAVSILQYFAASIVNNGPVATVPTTAATEETTTENATDTTVAEETTIAPTEVTEVPTEA